MIDANTFLPNPPPVRGSAIDNKIEFVTVSVRGSFLNGFPE